MLKAIGLGEVEAINVGRDKGGVRCSNIISLNNGPLATDMILDCINRQFRYNSCIVQSQRHPVDEYLSFSPKLLDEWFCPSVVLGGGGDCSNCSNGERLLGWLTGWRCRAAAACAIVV
jgi:hypothetical protein